MQSHVEALVIHLLGNAILRTKYLITAVALFLSTTFYLLFLEG